MKINDVIIEENITLGDNFDIELGSMVIETAVVGFMHDGIIVEGDAKFLALLGIGGALLENIDQSSQGESKEQLEAELAKLMQRFDPGFEFSDDHRFWKEQNAMQKRIGEIKSRLAKLDEAKYQGREVPLGKPMQGDVKKSKVYVKNPAGNVVKVNFGDPNMKIKKSNPARRKSFRARHRCATPGPRHKARYWSCRAW